jgi:hypothetical protein
MAPAKGCLCLWTTRGLASEAKKFPLVIRRGYGHRVVKSKSGHTAVRIVTRVSLAHYRQIYKTLSKFEGDVLYTALIKYINTIII